MRPTLVVLFLLLICGCAKRDPRTVITIWHQSRPTESKFLKNEIKRFEAANPNVHVRELYKETEELRSGFQAAALAGGGPELIFGPSDVLGALQTMGVVQDMAPWYPAELRDDFVDGALTYLPAKQDASKKELVQVADRFGNHLALIYNRHLVPTPPKTTDELLELAVKNTVSESGGSRKERYGLVWNFTEPFFGIPFLTGFGGWVFGEPSGTGSQVTTPAGSPTPSLDTPQAIAAWTFMQSLTEKGVAPLHCDYELADSLFKTGRAAMIINGDWSWGDYLATPEIDAAVAVLPTVSATGEPMRTMFAPKGYSLNVNTQPEIAAEAMAFVRYMTSDSVQQRVVTDLRMLPARRSLQNDPQFKNDATLQVSLEQLKNGRLMPVDTELRAIWDAMRPSYQALLANSTTPAAAAEEMQRAAVEKIAQI
ncbi:MAG TPA: extracellular solute-binding protein, partial [Lacipirellulaceae bacterium]|nr:extracellular solute-binding protein [Lacipirellulaceae bacterium]